MTLPSDWPTTAAVVVAVYVLTGWALGAHRRRDPLLWIAASMAALLLLSGLSSSFDGRPAHSWYIVAGIALGAWAWRRWRLRPRTSAPPPPVPPA